MHGWLTGIRTKVNENRNKTSKIGISLNHFLPTLKLWIGVYRWPLCQHVYQFHIAQPRALAVFNQGVYKFEWGGGTSMDEHPHTYGCDEVNEFAIG